MNYITTNIRIPESDYKRLKKEALEQNKSFSKIIREKIAYTNSEQDTEKLFYELANIGKKMKTYFSEKSSLELLREDRYEKH